MAGRNTLVTKQFLKVLATGSCASLKPSVQDDNKCPLGLRLIQLRVYEGKFLTLIKVSGASGKAGFFLPYLTYLGIIQLLF